MRQTRGILMPHLSTSSIHGLGVNQIRFRLMLCVILSFIVPRLLYPLLTNLVPDPLHLVNSMQAGLVDIQVVLLLLPVAAYIVDRQAYPLLALPLTREQTRRRLFQLLLSGIGLLVGQLLASLVVAVILANYERGGEWLMPPAAFVLASLLFAVFYVAIPITLYGMTLLGQGLGGRQWHDAIEVSRFRLLISSLAVPLVMVSAAISGSVLMYLQFEYLLVLQGLVLVLYTMLILGLNLHAARVALAPLNGYLAGTSDVADPHTLLPQSFDDTGVATAALREMLLRSQASETRLREFAELSTDFFYEIDARGKITYLDSRFGGDLDFPIDKLLGLNLAEAGKLFLPEGRALVSAKIELREAFRDIRLALAKPVNGIRNIKVSGAPRYSSAGEYLGYRGVGRDITESVRVNELLANQQGQLFQTRKMEVVGQLASGVAHDFNNLLTVVIGNLEMIRAAGDANLGADKPCQEALTAAKNGARLVAKLMMFARQQPVHPTDVNLGTMLSGMLSMLRHSLRGNIKINLELPERPVYGLIDKHQLENAVLSLAVNARDAMPRGGTVTLQLSEAQVKLDMELKPGRYSVLTMMDTGEGMSQAIVDAAIEPFFTTKGFGKGSGLGLSMVYGLLKQSGGRVLLDSTPAVGTRVSLYIPVGQQPAAVEEVLSQPQRRMSDYDEANVLLSKRLLVVEDDAAVRRLLSLQLQSLGFAVTAVGDAETAMQTIDRDANFDLVITDITLPGGMDGVELGARIMARSSDNKVLYISGYSERQVEVDPAHFLGKPYTLKDLSKAVNARLEVAEL